MGRNISPIDETMAILAGQQQIYLLGEDPGGFIAKKFPAHPGYAYVVEWFISDVSSVRSFKLLDNGQIYESDCIFEQTALFDTFEEAKTAAEEFDRRAGVGTTIAV